MLLCRIADANPFTHGKCRHLVYPNEEELDTSIMEQVLFALRMKTVLCAVEGNNRFAFDPAGLQCYTGALSKT